MLADEKKAGAVQVIVPFLPTTMLISYVEYCPACKLFFFGNHPNNGCEFSDIFDVCES
jgi:hypothetical protein